MIPYPFTYVRAISLGDAKTRLIADLDARLIAGGQTLTAAMKTRLASPSTLIDISALKELTFIEADARTLAIGAGVTHADVATSAQVKRVIPALAELAENIGDPAIRNRGTIGGAVANNDPAADYPAAVLALNATLVTSDRSIAADAFFTGMFSTALEQGEILTSVSFPIPLSAAYAKFANPASRYAMAGVFVARFPSCVRVAVTGAASCVYRLPEYEAALEKNFSPSAIANLSVDSAELNSDIHGSAEYRANLVAVMARRAVAAALER